MSFSYLLESDNLNRDQLRKYNVSELQGILGQLNLDTNGKKHELVDRLFQFWVSIQTPAAATPPPPEVRFPVTCCVRFGLQSFPDCLELRAKLETYGHIASMLVDPSELFCLVCYRKPESSQKLLSDAPELGFLDAKCVRENDIEKKSKELELIGDGFQLHNFSQKRFRKTQTEPRLYWCSAPRREEPE
jgi:hypothetical protein